LFVSSLRTSGILLVFTVGGHKIGIDKYIKIRSDNKLKKLYLKGIVYHGFHFVLCVVGKDNTVWFHDRKLGRNCIYI
jgi:hypothetical protein